MSAGAHHGEAMQLMKERLLSDSKMIQRVLLAFPRVHKLDRILVQSGLKLNVGVFLGFSLALGLAAFIASRFFPLPLLLSLLISTVATLVVTALVMKLCMRAETAQGDAP